MITVIYYWKNCKRLIKKTRLWAFLLQDLNKCPTINFSVEFEHTPPFFCQYSFMFISLKTHLEYFKQYLTLFPSI